MADPTQAELAATHAADIADKSPDIVPGSDEYNTEMARRYTNPTEPDVNKPDELPKNPKPEDGHDKFYNKETGDYNWQAHAVDADYRAKGGTVDPAKGDEQTVKPGDDEAVEDVVTKAGLKMEDLGAQIVADGKITDEAKAALVAQGIPAALIDEHVALVVGKVAANTAAGIEHIGGEQKWNAISQWAAQNIPEEEKADINKRLAGDNWQAAMDDLATRYTKASPTGGETALLQGDQPAGAGALGYLSREEMIADQQRPEYRKDPAFRAKIIARIAATDEEKMYASYDN